MVIIMTIIVTDVVVLIKKHSYFLILGFFSLFIGFLIYSIFRENTYIFEMANTTVPLEKLKGALGFLDNEFIKFYLPDYLWALSLSSYLNVIFNYKKKYTFLCTLIVFIFGAAYEFMQYIGVINGTGDVVDIFLYLLAGITVNIINFKRSFENEKNL